MSEERLEPKSKAERLAFAAAVAPMFRGQDARAAQRRVKTYNQATGETTGEATIAELQEGLLRQYEIEMEVGPGIRPSLITCANCKKPVVVPPKGRIPMHCRACRQPKCSVCSKPLANMKAKRCRPCKDAQTRPPSISCRTCGKALSLKARVKARAGTAIGQCLKCWREAKAASGKSVPVALLPGCAKCGKKVARGTMRPETVARRKGAPPRCKACLAKHPDPECAECGAALQRSVMAPSAVKRRGGAPPRCHACSHQKPTTGTKTRTHASNR